MPDVCLILGTGLLLFAAGHFAMAAGFRLWLGRRRREHPSGRRPNEESPFPEAAVLIAARGIDPSFAEMFRAVTSQRWPCYEVIVALDSDGKWDPQWLPDWETWMPGQPAENRIDGGIDPRNRSTRKLVPPTGGGPTVTVLEGFAKKPDCGLKCSALIAAWELVSPNTDVCAFLDADIVPGPDWLGQLVHAAMLPQCGVASGVVWFEPPDRRCGTLVRSLFNAAAVFPTAVFGNPWAGSMALRREVILRSGLVEKWSRSVVDDGPVRKAVQSLGLQAHFVPGLVLCNRESCSLAFAANWIGRMMKWSRLHDPSFSQTLLHAIVSAALLGGTAACLFLSAIAHAWLAVVWLMGLAAAASLLLVAGWWMMRGACRETGHAEGTIRMTGHALRLTLACWFLIPVTLAVFCWAALGALVRQRYRWRGVDYWVQGDGSVMWEVVQEPPAARTPRKESL